MQNMDFIDFYERSKEKKSSQHQTGTHIITNNKDKTFVTNTNPRASMLNSYSECPERME